MAKKRPTFSITSKKGDSGQTGLLGDARVAKYDLRPEAYGTLDEANALIGLVRATTQLADVANLALLIQQQIYFINSELACPPDCKHLLKRVLAKPDLEKLSASGQELEKKLDLPRKFVLYGASPVSASLDVARAVMRRAERRIVELHDQEPLENPFILAWMNRCSDVLFLLARYEESAHKIPYQTVES